MVSRRTHIMNREIREIDIREPRQRFYANLVNKVRESENAIPPPTAARKELSKPIAAFENTALPPPVTQQGLQMRFTTSRIPNALLKGTTYPFSLTP
ncbi:hypothetical protein Y032_0020g207 [Ancylostoma ceylanicum]|nr:hypothetical protein Y032_0020g207 [Ancylostoma ceylanicum]